VTTQREPTPSDGRPTGLPTATQPPEEASPEDAQQTDPTAARKEREQRIRTLAAVREDVIRTRMQREGVSYQVAEEAFQEALLAAWKMPDITRVEVGLLFDISKKRCIDVIRKQGTARSAKDSVRQAPLHGSIPRPDDHLEAEERRRLVREALALLPESYKKVIEQELEGRDDPRLSETLGITEGAVRQRRSRAYGMLRGLLLSYEACEDIS
jgi:RNA polymerase sigma factor (sigma-70 family)